MLVVGDSRIVAVEDHSSYMYFSFQSEESLKKILGQPPKDRPPGDSDVKKSGRLGSNWDKRHVFTTSIQCFWLNMLDSMSSVSQTFKLNFLSFCCNDFFSFSLRFLRFEHWKTSFWNILDLGNLIGFYLWLSSTSAEVYFWMLKCGSWLPAEELCFFRWSYRTSLVQPQHTLDHVASMI